MQKTMQNSRKPYGELSRLILVFAAHLVSDNPYDTYMRNKADAGRYLSSVVQAKIKPIAGPLHATIHDLTPAAADTYLYFSENNDPANPTHRVSLCLVPSSTCIHTNDKCCMRCLWTIQDPRPYPVEIASTTKDGIVVWWAPPSKLFNSLIAAKSPFHLQRVIRSPHNLLGVGRELKKSFELRRQLSFQIHLGEMLRGVTGSQTTLYNHHSKGRTVIAYELDETIIEPTLLDVFDFQQVATHPTRGSGEKYKQYIIADIDRATSNLDGYLGPQLRYLGSDIKTAEPIRQRQMLAVEDTHDGISREVITQNELMEPDWEDRLMRRPLDKTLLDELLLGGIVPFVAIQKQNGWSDNTDYTQRDHYDRPFIGQINIYAPSFDRDHPIRGVQSCWVGEGTWRENYPAITRVGKRFEANHTLINILKRYLTVPVSRSETNGWSRYVRVLYLVSQLFFPPTSPRAQDPLTTFAELGYDMDDDDTRLYHAKARAYRDYQEVGEE